MATVEQVVEATTKLEEELRILEAGYQEERQQVVSKLNKLKAWLWENGTHTAESIIEEYVAIRNKRGVLKEKYDDQDEILKAELDKREVWLLAQLDSIGAKSMRGEAGTAYISQKVKASCSDWPTYWNYIRETGRFDLLEKRVSQKPISDMLEEGVTLPPGINTFVERTVTVRKS